MYFRDRFDAALKIIPFLKKFENTDGVVLAVPRGGVPIGYYIAKQYNFPLEIILTKKIGHPYSSELAVGAVSMEGRVIDPQHRLPEDYLERETDRIQKILRQRYTLFMGDRKPIDLKGKTVIVVDDGIATGNTMLATLQLLRLKHPKQIIVAVPVAPPETVQKLKQKADEIICVYSPEEFYGVGQFYEDFRQVTDEEVIQLLNEANSWRRVA